MTRLVVLLFAICAAIPAMANRDCTDSETASSDERLVFLQKHRSEKAHLRSRHAPFRLHRSTVGTNQKTLYQPSFLSSHDQDLRTSLWVSYKLTAQDLNDASGRERVNCFRQDPRLDADKTSVLDDYDEDIYDRGHLANDADMKDVTGEQIATYVLSNMSPQHCHFNRGIWLSLENLTRNWANDHGEIWVVVGAVFDRDGVPGRDDDDDARRMVSKDGNSRVAVPSHYYRTVIRPDGDQWRSVSFMLEHNNTNHGNSAQTRPHILASIVSMADIEERASVRLHPGLDRDDVIETTDGSNWDFTGSVNNMNHLIASDSKCVTTLP